MRIQPGPGPALRSAAHRQPPGALCGNKRSYSLLPGTARLRQLPSGTAGCLGAHPRKSFSHMNDTAFPSSALRLALLLRGFPLETGKPLAVSSGNFGGCGLSTLRPSTQPEVPGSFPGCPRFLPSPANAPGAVGRGDGRR